VGGHCVAAQQVPRACSHLSRCGARIPAGAVYHRPGGNTTGFARGPTNAKSCPYVLKHCKDRGASTGGTLRPGCWCRPASSSQTEWKRNRSVTPQSFGGLRGTRRNTLGSVRRSNPGDAHSPGHSPPSESFTLQPTHSPCARRSGTSARCVVYLKAAGSRHTLMEPAWSSGRASTGSEPRCDGSLAIPRDATPHLCGCCGEGYEVRPRSSVG
jgi:hypothetical protein